LRQLGLGGADEQSRVKELDFMSAPPPKHFSRTHVGTSRPVDPASWLEQTENLVDRYRERLNATAGPGADPGLGYIWIAADHIFEARGRAADFALLDVPVLMEDCAWLATGKTRHFVTALSAFYAFLADARLIDPGRAVSIQAELARALPPPAKR
jgi:hypothetical protein